MKTTTLPILPPSLSFLWRAHYPNGLAATLSAVITTDHGRSTHFWAVDSLLGSSSSSKFAVTQKLCPEGRKFGERVHDRKEKKMLFDRPKREETEEQTRFLLKLGLYQKIESMEGRLYGFVSTTRKTFI